MSLYGNYIEGLTQGETAPTFVVTPPPPVNAGQMLAPYVSKQKEVGGKLDLGRFGADLALFGTSKARSLINAANVFTSAGEDLHRGVEINLRGEAMRGLRLLGGLTWLDADQKTTGSAATDGKRVIGVPEVQANLGGWLPCPAWRWNGRLLSTGSSYADAANTLKVPGWTRLDLGVRYIVDMDRTAVTLRARVDNATDRNYWSSVGGYPGSGYLVVGGPHAFNLSASVDF